MTSIYKQCLCYSFYNLTLIGQGDFCYWYNQLPRLTSMMHTIFEKDGKICKNIFLNYIRTWMYRHKVQFMNKNMPVKWATTKCQKLYLRLVIKKLILRIRKLRFKVRLKNNSNLGWYDFKVIAFPCFSTTGLQD